MAKSARLRHCANAGWRQNRISAPRRVAVRRRGAPQLLGGRLLRTRRVSHQTAKKGDARVKRIASDVRPATRFRTGVAYIGEPSLGRDKFTLSFSSTPARSGVCAAESCGLWRLARAFWRRTAKRAKRLPIGARPRRCGTAGGAFGDSISFGVDTENAPNLQTGLFGFGVGSDMRVARWSVGSSTMNAWLRPSRSVAAEFWQVLVPLRALDLSHATAAISCTFFYAGFGPGFGPGYAARGRG